MELPMRRLLLLLCFLSCAALPVQPRSAITIIKPDLVKVRGGILEGTTGPDEAVRIFRGVPYAAAPMGRLRWRPPQPVKPWKGIRKAEAWGNRCLQGMVFQDIQARESGMSEDCLYLNIWSGAGTSSARLPVFVWFHGGGFAVGSGSEPRYDGEDLASRGLVVVDVNYRLGVFGFLAHPELTRESPHRASGNYGLLDQVQALEWVKQNIAAFGGDPGNVTIGGESAGASAVCALMASPLAKGLFHKAIGESGAAFPSANRPEMPRKDAEKTGLAFAGSLGTRSLADLRRKPAQELLEAALKQGAFHFGPILDGHFLPASAAERFGQGLQATVPLLAGWNSGEAGSPAALRTWKWIEAHLRTSAAPVYRFQFDRGVPDPDGTPKPGVPHAAEIEYVFNTLDTKVALWQPEDYRTGRSTSAYWVNFIQTGNPNGLGLPAWPEFRESRRVMHLDEPCEARPETDRETYLAMDAVR
jgi:para-nitrobenzyl esterase